jgi:hypothetical protein
MPQLGVAEFFAARYLDYRPEKFIHALQVFLFMPVKQGLIALEKNSIFQPVQSEGKVSINPPLNLQTVPQS